MFKGKKNAEKVSAQQPVGGQEYDVTSGESDSIYENVPSKLASDDKLLYADLDKVALGSGSRDKSGRRIIIGAESKTEYADIKFGAVGSQLEDDQLLYADLDEVALGSGSRDKSGRRIVIGAESKTGYADIKFGAVGPQLEDDEVEVSDETAPPELPPKRMGRREQSESPSVQPSSNDQAQQSGNWWSRFVEFLARQVDRLRNFVSRKSENVVAEHVHENVGNIPKVVQHEHSNSQDIPSREHGQDGVAMGSRDVYTTVVKQGRNNDVDNGQKDVKSSAMRKGEQRAHAVLSKGAINVEDLKGHIQQPDGSEEGRRGGNFTPSGAHSSKIKQSGGERGGNFGGVHFH